MEMLNDIENDNLVKDRENLRRFEKEIIMDSNKDYDEIHMDFVNSRELTFEETLLAREIFEYMKNRK